ACLVLLQYADDLFVCETIALHPLVLSMGQSLLQNGLFQRGKVTEFRKPFEVPLSRFEACSISCKAGALRDHPDPDDSTQIKVRLARLSLKSRDCLLTVGWPSLTAISSRNPHSRTKRRYGRRIGVLIFCLRLSRLGSEFVLIVA
ncbi:hypothetical protein, partial [Rhizobium leguminosarum]|uniref:hypothetical protein n=1 Tax=Rhizobium leguminosarum TaxID=384 RepID=UPI00197E7B7F